MNACEKCGSDRKLNARFCSQACNRDMATARRWKGHKIEGQFDGRHCARCTEPILRKRYKNWPEMIDKWRSRKYCSRICSRAAVASPTREDGAVYEKRGYVLINNPDCCDLHRGRTKLREHIVKAEHAIGRLLKTAKPMTGDSELVHHINGNKRDNRNENLLICTNSYHHWLHARMSFMYQQEKFT